MGSGRRASVDFNTEKKGEKDPRKIEVAEARSLVRRKPSPSNRPTEGARLLPRMPKPRLARRSRRIAVPGAASVRGGRRTFGVTEEWQEYQALTGSVTNGF